MCSTHRSTPAALDAAIGRSAASSEEPVEAELCLPLRDEFLELDVLRGPTSVVQREGKLQESRSQHQLMPELEVGTESNPYASPVMEGDPGVRLEYNRARGDIGKLNRRLDVWSDRQKIVLAAALGFGDLASSAFSGPLSSNFDGKLVFAAVVSVWAAALYKTAQKIQHVKEAREIAADLSNQVF